MKQCNVQCPEDCDAVRAVSSPDEPRQAWLELGAAMLGTPAFPQASPSGRAKLQPTHPWRRRPDERPAPPSKLPAFAGGSTTRNPGLAPRHPAGRGRGGCPGTATHGTQVEVGAVAYSCSRKSRCGSHSFAVGLHGGSAGRGGGRTAPRSSGAVKVAPLADALGPARAGPLSSGGLA